MTTVGVNDHLTAAATPSSAGLEQTAAVGAAAGQARETGGGTPETAVSASQARLQQSAPSPAEGAAADAAACGGELMRTLMRQVFHSDS